jgi:hypothetical protein
VAKKATIATASSKQLQQPDGGGTDRPSLIEVIKVLDAKS